MRSKFFIITGIIGLALILSCSNETTSSLNNATIHGTVYGLEENDQLIVLPDAQIDVENYFSQSISNQNGIFQLDVQLDDNVDQQTVRIIASKAGYESASANVLAKKGENIKAPDITLTKIFINDSTTVPTGEPSGDAAHIEIYGDHPQHIYVTGAGLAETTKLVFAVRDSEGRLVDENHQIAVNFEITDGPDGGEYLSPETMTTQDGLVYTVLNSGTVAGAVQIMATATLANNVNIAAKPIRVAIFGGLPDPSHFSMAVDVLNIAGLKYFGLLDAVTAFVGDKYSNPVAPGTVVYFASDYGIVDGSAVTDEMGRATVQFMSARPVPPTPALNPFAFVTGWTYSDTLAQNTITDKIRILLSDQTAAIIVNPSSFTYSDANAPVHFDYTVEDIWGHPIVGGSSIKVTATAGKVVGDINVSMQDTQLSGPGATQFEFSWAPGDSLKDPQVYININVTTPAKGNGNQSVNIIGSKQ